MLRQRDVAQVVVDQYSRGTAFSIEHLVRDGFLDTVDIYEVGLKRALLLNPWVI